MKYTQPIKVKQLNKLLAMGYFYNVPQIRETADKLWDERCSKGNCPHSKNLKEFEHLFYVITGTAGFYFRTTYGLPIDYFCNKHLIPFLQTEKGV